MAKYHLQKRPLANPNPEKAFCPEYRYKDLDPSNLNDNIAKFEARIKYWFLKPTKELIRKDIKNSNFIVIIMICVITDLLSQYWYGLPSSDGRQYKEFLKIFMRSFKSKIKPPLKYYMWDKDRRVWQERFVQDYSQAFYQIFRCGLLHNAMIMDCGRISSKSILKKSIKLRSWKFENKKGKEIAVNPILLFKNLEMFFKQYINKLFNSNEEELRKNFVRKFEWDFGVRII